jgi:hypothetical protein
MVADPSTTISLSSAAGATAPETLLVRYISAHVRKGEQAEERASRTNEHAPPGRRRPVARILSPDGERRC